ncbi:MAG: hypothetical protein P8163_17160 [Candidatus Thiodiazotropha sp.]
MALEVSANEKSESRANESNVSLTKEDIFNIPDDDYVFMQEISANEAFMPTSEDQIFRYNSLVSHG